MGTLYFSNIFSVGDNFYDIYLSYRQNLFLHGRNIFCKYLCSLVTDLIELLCILLGKALHAIVGYYDFTFL